MLLKTVKITLRQFQTHKLYSIINVLGLGVGLACCLMITLFVVHELSYDRQYRNADRLALVYQSTPQERDTLQGNSSMLAAPLLKQDFPEIVDTARLSGKDTVVSTGNLVYTENIQFADANIFNLFDFDWLTGDAETALENPNSIVLTESTARKYFGEEPAAGKTLMLDNNSPVTVTGVIADLPSNTTLDLSAIAPLDLVIAGYEKIGMDMARWGAMFFSTYALLDDADSIASVRAGLPEFAQRYTGGDGNTPRTFEISRLTRLHLYRNFRGGAVSLSNLVRVEIFTAIAVCVLIIAVINFMNLSTARASWRAKEVGVSFVVGARRPELIRKFLMEAVMYAVIALAIALMITELFLAVLNGWLQFDLSLGQLFNPAGVLVLAAVTVLTGILAGSYPAFYLSSFRPVKILKGEVTRGNAGAAMRNLLVVFQFAISITLIIVSTCVLQQMRYIRHFDPGFNKDLMLTLTFPDADVFDVNTRWEGFRNRLLEDPNVLEATHAMSSPLMEGRLGSALKKEGSDEEPLDANMFMMADNFLQTYGIKLLAGRYPGGAADRVRIRDLGRDSPGSSSGGMVLNALAARGLGWTPAEALGRELRAGVFGGGLVSPVIGVVENTVSTPRQLPEALFYVVPDTFNYSFFHGQASIKIAGNDLPATLAHIDDVWKEFMPGEPINRRFLDERIEAGFQQENLQMKLFTVAAAVGVLVACFGLYGLATFNTERRTKEIGVRKVMGGSVWSIVLLLTNDFSKLVLISNLIAWPVAFFAMQRWLENFAYRIDLTPLIFIGSGLIALCIAWVTVGGTAAKAASRKPVLALRYE